MFPSQNLPVLVAKPVEPFILLSKMSEKNEEGEEFSSSFRIVRNLFGALHRALITCHQTFCLLMLMQSTFASDSLISKLSR